MQCVSRCHSARRGKSLALVEADEAVRRTGDAVRAAPVGFLGGELPALTLGSFPRWWRRIVLHSPTTTKATYDLSSWYYG